MLRLPRGFKPTPFKYHEELSLRVESLTNLGVGIARERGWVVMIPGVIPGERIRARVYMNRKNYSEADLVQVRKSVRACAVYLCMYGSSA